MSTAPDDIADAQVILNVARSVSSRYVGYPADSRNLVRSAIDLFWDGLRTSARTPSRRVDDALWSPPALLQARYDRNHGLIGEHIMPLCRVSDELIRSCIDGNDPTADDLAQQLRDNAWVVITAAQGKVLKEAGVLRSMPKDWDGLDRWARYSCAGIAVSGFTRWVERYPSH